MSDHHLLQWSEHFQLKGHQDLDDQHHQLFEMVNQLDRLIRHNADTDELVALTLNLYLHTVDHFKAEEALFDRLAPEQRILHTLQHKHYLEALNAFLERLQSGVIMSAESMTDQLRSLADWYQCHVLDSDQLLCVNLSYPLKP